MKRKPTVFVVDDDDGLRAALAASLTEAGLKVRQFASAESFLAACDPGCRGCLIVDLKMPGMSGDELPRELAARNVSLPIIFITGYGTVETSVAAMRAGAIDFLEKPVAPDLLLSRVEEALELDHVTRDDVTKIAALRTRFSRLSRRELEVIAHIVQGESNKEIARHLSISFRTVEKYRATALMKLNVTNLTELCAIGHQVWRDILQPHYEKAATGTRAPRPDAPA